MIALPRTRDFSAGNWQILLTNNLNTVRRFGVYMAPHSLGRSDSSFFSKADFIQNRIKEGGGDSRRHKCHDKQVAGMSRSYYAEGSEGLTSLPHVYPDQDTHSWAPKV
jgi:hypothetical protein